MNTAVRAPVLAAVLPALLAGACAAMGRPPSDPQRLAARAGNDLALQGSQDRLGPLEGHFVAAADGKVLGGTMLREDTVRLLEGLPGPLHHAYFFVAGSEGKRRVPMPGIYGPRVAGTGLLGALGVEILEGPSGGTLVLGRGEVRRTFRFGTGAAAATFRIEPASGLGRPIRVDLVVAPGFEGTALVAREDALAAGLALSEVPGEATVTEILTGKSIPCRRALALVTLERLDDDPALNATGLVEVYFPQ